MPETSVKGLLQWTDALGLENTGIFWHANGEVLPCQTQPLPVSANA